MKTPRWLADEIDELGRRVGSGEIDRSEAISSLQDHIFEKDEELAQAITADWVSAKLDDKVRRWTNARRRDATDRLEQMASGQVQTTFDEYCSDYWPRDTYGPQTTLRDLGMHAEDMLGLAERHSNRAKERHQRWLELVDAAGGNLDATWADAERARLGLAGDGAAAADG